MVSISMKWQNFQEHLTFELCELLKSESMVDVTLKAEDETFYAHRIILSASSPFFQELLAPIDRECHPIIILDEMPACDINALLQFIYHGELKVEGLNLSSVLKSAADLKITALLEIENHFIENPIENPLNQMTKDEVEVLITTPPPHLTKSSPLKQLPLQNKTNNLNSSTYINNKNNAKQKSPSVLSKNLYSQLSNLSSSKAAILPLTPTPSSSSIPSYNKSSVMSLPLSTQLSLKPLHSSSNSISTYNETSPNSSLDTLLIRKDSRIVDVQTAAIINDNKQHIDLSIGEDPSELHLSFDLNETCDLPEALSGKQIKMENSDLITSTLMPIQPENNVEEVHVVQLGEAQTMDEDSDSDATWLCEEGDDAEVEDDEDYNFDKLLTLNLHTQTNKNKSITACNVYLPRIEEAIEEIITKKSTYAEVSRKYDIPKSTLYYRIRQLGITNEIGNIGNMDLEVINTAVQAVKDGATLREASMQYGIPKTVLWRRVTTSLGRGTLTERFKSKSKYTQQSLDIAILAIQKGDRIADISKKYSIPISTLHREKLRLLEAGALPHHQRPIKKKRYRKDSVKQENLLQAAEMVRRKRMTIATASLTFNVPKVTIWRKMNELNNKQESGWEENEVEEIILLPGNMMYTSDDSAVSSELLSMDFMEQSQSILTLSDNSNDSIGEGDGVVIERIS